MTCHSEGAFVATEESRMLAEEILRFAQNDMKNKYGFTRT